MNEVMIRPQAVAASTVFPEFSWRAVVAGALVASAVIFFLLFLGMGVGLSFLSIPQSTAHTAQIGLTLGAIYFFSAQAFGLAAGGYLAGRLMGPVLESEPEETFHATAHGLTTWALAVVMTVTMVAISSLALAGTGLQGAAILGGTATAQKTAPEPVVNGYWIDTLFRTNSITTANPAPTAGTISVARSDVDARAEAGRILTVGLLRGEKLSQSDHDQLAQLVSRSTGIGLPEAAMRVEDVQTLILQDAARVAEEARKLTRFVSLWLAASLVFGALVSAGAAVSGRRVDDVARSA